MRYVLDVDKLGMVGRSLVNELFIIRAAQRIVDKAPETKFAGFHTRAVITPKMKARMRKLRKNQKTSRRKNNSAY